MNTSKAISEESEVQMPKIKFLDGVDIPVFLISGGALVLFCILALYDINMVSGWVNSTFAASTKMFGAYWQVLLLSNFYYWHFYGDKSYWWRSIRRIKGARDVDL